MKLLGKLLAVFAAFVFAVGVIPSRALAADNLAPVTDPSFFDNGTYVFESISSSTDAIPVNHDDGPAMAIVDGDNVTLVIDIYAPGTYDKLFPGKRSEAPNPSASSLINAQFVTADNFSGNTETWTDDQGLVGPSGITYKAVRFFIPMEKSEFMAMLSDGGGNLYITVRNSWWNSDNPLKWVDTNDHYLALGTPEKTSNSTGLPKTWFLDKIEPVKQLIEALPVNPYVVEESNRTAIEEAAAAYDALPTASQEELDSERTSESQSYGRMLESLVWALDSLQTIDDTTTLPDGTYTKEATSTCSVGKSDRARTLFSVVKIIVQDGHTQALIEHNANTSDTVRTGSIEYPHVNTDENAHSQFLIPVDLNKTFHISQFAKNPTANTVGIVYEMTITIDEQNAKSDTSQATPAASTPTSSGQTSASNGTRNNTSALSAVAQARQSGTVGSITNSTASAKKEEQVAESKRGSTTVSTASHTTNTSDDVNTTGVVEGNQGSPIDALPITFGMLCASTALGIGGFSIVFYRRESRLIPWLRSA